MEINNGDAAAEWVDGGVSSAVKATTLYCKLQVHARAICLSVVLLLQMHFALFSVMPKHAKLP